MITREANLCLILLKMKSLRIFVIANSRSGSFWKKEPSFHMFFIL